MGYLEMSLWSQMSKVMAIYLAVTVSYIHTQLLYHFLYAPLARKHISLPAVPKVKSGPSVQCTCRSLMGSSSQGSALPGPGWIHSAPIYWALVALILETAAHKKLIALMGILLLSKWYWKAVLYLPWWLHCAYNCQHLWFLLWFKAASNYTSIFCVSLYLFPQISLLLSAYQMYIYLYIYMSR